VIIDFHTHIFPSFFRMKRTLFFHEEPSFKSLYQSPKSKLAGRQELITTMDNEEVQKSVIFGFPWRKAEYCRRHNDYIMESVQHYPDRFIGFCCVDPLSKYASEETERCLRSGLMGVGELAAYNMDFTPEFFSSIADIMAISHHYDVPILLHTNEPVGHQYPGKQPMTLGQIYDLLKRFPSNRIVLAHWGGGLLFYALMKKEVKAVLENVWFDTAASPFLYVPDIYRVAGEIVGFKRILFGSDFPLLHPKRYLEEMVSAGLSNQSIATITEKNARYLLERSQDMQGMP
jgi:predicted TIM-barrel fold metal-dependent hydrolase